MICLKGFKFSLNKNQYVWWFGHLFDKNEDILSSEPNETPAFKNKSLFPLPFKDNKLTLALKNILQEQANKLIS